MLSNLYICPQFPIPMVLHVQHYGFEMTDSMANFIFAKNDKIDGEKLYLELKEQGVLVRHFTSQRIKDFNRITIGTPKQMQVLVEKIKDIITEAV